VAHGKHPPNRVPGNNIPHNINDDEDVCEGTEHKMRNIAYALSGYDQYFGNPSFTQSGGQLVDPGLRDQIFAAVYDGTLTADNRYCIPEGTGIIACNNCKLDFQSDTFTGVKKYMDRLRYHVGIQFWLGGTFGASLDYNHVHEETTNHTNIFVGLDTSCCAYTASIQKYAAPNFTQNFLNALQTLTDDYDENIYMSFISSFGTQYVKRATLGATYGEQSEYTYDSWLDLESKQIDVKLFANFHAMKSVGMETNTSTSWNQTSYETWQKSKKELKVYAIGAKPPSGDVSQWQGLVVEEPYPLNLELEKITMLPISDLVSPRVMDNLETALSGYCDKLLEQGVLTSCDPPGNDRPFPESRYWTGWTNNQKPGKEFAFQECQMGHYVTQMRWHQFQHGFCDVQIKCSGMDWSPAVTGCEHYTKGKHFWTNPISCDEDDHFGFSEVTGREHRTGPWGIVNAKSRCVGSTIDVLAGDIMSGEWNKDLKCAGGRRITGFQVRKSSHYDKLINFQAHCG